MAVERFVGHLPESRYLDQAAALAAELVSVAVAVRRLRETRRTRLQELQYQVRTQTDPEIARRSSIEGTLSTEELQKM